MYTRFKNQKTGLKLGLNSIATNRKVVIPTSCTNNLASSIGSSSISTSSSNQSLNSADFGAKSQKNSGETSPLYSPSTTIINPVLSVSSVLIDDNNNENLFNDKNKTISSQTETTLIPFQFNNDGTNFEAKSNLKNTKKEHNSQNEKKIEEPIDLTCISYVKTMWDKYSSEIGTQDGPLRHVDENEQYPHLNGFVAFDMEHWWAERSISTMIKKENSDSMENKEIKKNNTIENKDFLAGSALKKTPLNITTNTYKTSSKLNRIPQLNSFNLCFS